VSHVFFFQFRSRVMLSEPLSLYNYRTNFSTLPNNHVDAIFPQAILNGMIIIVHCMDNL
jgi:hypothetical protein